VCGKRFYGFGCVVAHVYASAAPHRLRSRHIQVLRQKGLWLRFVCVLPVLALALVLHHIRFAAATHRWGFCNDIFTF
jgi:hypothetical protein